MSLPLSPLAGPRVAEFRAYPAPSDLPASLLAWFRAEEEDFEPIAAETLDLDLNAWTKTGIATATSGQADPDGGTGAYLLTEDTSTGLHLIEEATPGASTNLIEVRASLKAGTRTQGQIRIGTLSAVAQGVTITNLDTTPVIAALGGTRAYYLGSRTDSGAGVWHDFVCFAEVDVQFFRFYIRNAGAENYLGASGTLYAYAPAGSYRARVVQDADGVGPSPADASWGKTNCTVVAGFSDPLGGTDACEITDTVDGSSVAHIVEEASANILTGRTITWEPWARPGTGQGGSALSFMLGRIGGLDVQARFNLTTGAVILLDNGATGECIATADDGWKQFRVQGVTDTFERARFRMTLTNGGTNYQGDGTSKVRVYTPLGSYQQKRVHRWQGVGSAPLRKSTKSYRFREGGATTSRIDVGNVAELGFGIADPFTLSCWFKTTSSTFSTLLSKAAGSGNFEGYMLAVSATGQIFFRLEGTAALNNKIEGSTTATFRDGAWHHVALTYSGSGLLSGCVVYVDGVARSLTSTTDAFTNALTNTVSFQIGNRDANSSFDGLIDEAAVYDKALSAGEITTIYNRVVPPDLLTVGPTANLVGYWPLGDDESGTAIDHSSSANDGTFVDLTVAALRDDAPAPVRRAEQAVDAQRPIITRVSAFGQDTALSFGGADDMLTADAFATAHAWGGGAPWTLLILVQWPEIVGTTQYCFGFASTTTNARRSIGVGATGANSVLLSSSDGTTTVSQVRALLNTDAAVLGVTDDGSGNWQFYLDGVANGALWAHGHNNVMGRCTIGAQRYNATPVVEGIAKCHLHAIAGFSQVLPVNQIRLISAGMRVAARLAA